MSPVRSSPRAVTPGSVKVLMLVEAGIIGFLSFWVASEYTYNAFFRVYVDEMFLSHITTYSAVLGLVIGLAGSATAAVFYKNLQSAKHRLETAVAPKIRGTVDKLLSSTPSLDSRPLPIVAEQLVSSSEKQPPSWTAPAIVPAPLEKEQKKDSSLS